MATVEDGREEKMVDRPGATGISLSSVEKSVVLHLSRDQGQSTPIHDRNSETPVNRIGPPDRIEPHPDRPIRVDLSSDIK